MSEIDELLQNGALARRTGRPAQALQAYDRAVSLAHDRGARLELVQALKGAAQIERDEGRPERALPHYVEAVTECRHLGEERLLAHTVRHLGDVHYALGDLAAAEAAFVEALELYRDIAATPAAELANAVRPLAVLSAETGRTADAVELWREARDLYRSVGLDAGVDEAEDWLRRLA